ncbi:RNA polymerase sigma factor [Hydrogenophaga sp. ZJX-1]|uniref:RNA polymerase sigma factor n=1 Tax=Hydrogenophaga sp. ZJX-1 TaxID=3404778 RepID=UPI003B288BD9
MSAAVYDPLLGDIAKGSMAAMERFYRQHERSVFRFALAQTGDRFDAAEVLNDVMLEVWRQAGRFEGRSTVTTWLLGIARFKSLDRLRARQRHGSEPLDEEAEDETPRAEQTMADAQEAHRLRECMGKLPSGQREIMHLAFFEDMGYEAIAALVQRPIGTVKSRVYHAKEAIKKCLSR